MSGTVLGIDLGTTNSVVAVANGKESRVLADAQGRRLIPSVVSFHPDTSILVGHEARERRLVDARNTVYSIKRLIGRPFTSIEVQKARERSAFELEPTKVGGVQVRVRRGTFALPEISAMVLRHLRRVAEDALGEPCTRAVVTVPANFNELQRSATQAAGKVAGLEVLRILNEPTAATLAYGYGKDRPETIAVYDLGGGTFDLTILDLEKDVFEVVSTAGDTFLGGDDFDLLVAEKMADTCLRQHRYDAKTDPQVFERMRAAAEWAKCQLSSVEEVELTLEELFPGPHGKSVDFQFHMKRSELDNLVRPLVARSFDIVNDALRAAGRRPKDIGSVILVGGSTRTPLIRNMVEEFFQRPARADIDPDLVVAQGAAIHGFTLAGEAKPAQKGQALARVALRKQVRPAVREERAPRQPAFAPDDGRDAPLVSLPRRGGDDKPAQRVGEARRVGSSASLPRAEVSTKSQTLQPAAPSGPPQAPSSDDDFADATTSVHNIPSIQEIEAAERSRDQLNTAPPARPPISAVPSKLEDITAPPPPVVVPPPVAVAPPRVRKPSERKIAAQPVSILKPPAAVGVREPSSNHLLNLDQPDESPLAAENTTRFDPATAQRPRKPTMVGGAIDLDLPDVQPRPGVPSRKKTLDPAAGISAPSLLGELDLSDPVAPPTPAEPSIVIDPSLTSDAGLGLDPGLLSSLESELGTLEVVGQNAPKTVEEPLPPPRKMGDRRPGATSTSKMAAFVEDPPAPPPPRPRAPAPPAPPAPPAAPQRSLAPLDLGGLFDSGSEPSSPPPPLEMMPLGAAPVVPVAAAPIAPAIAVGAPRQPVIAMPERRAPLLMDVTPLSLGIETAGGFVQQIVTRNAPVPTEKTRIFSTARDEQTEVEVKICQGDSNVFNENQALGTLLLSSIRQARRGDVRIEVTFMIDASGILDVKATDLDQKKQQQVRIALRGGMDNSEVEEMKKRQSELFDG